MQIPFHKAHITDDEISAVVDSLRAGRLTMGPKTLEFEGRFRDYIFQGSAAAGDRRFAVSFNSGTAALHLALKAIRLRAGEEVILPTNAFVAAAEVVTHFGAVPVLCDIEKGTHNMDAAGLERLITRRTKAIVPVHFGGQPCDMDAITALAEMHDLRVIDDASHALPSGYRNRRIGAIGDITCFSFFAANPLCTVEGGMATTANEDYAQSMAVNRLHGISRKAWEGDALDGNWHYEVLDNGFKYNTTDINASLGLAQLSKIDWMRSRRADIAARYDEMFADAPIVRPELKKDRETSRHLYVIKVGNRDELAENLKRDGIGTQVHFIPVHRHPYYRRTFGYKDRHFPVANMVFEKSLSLPIYPGLTDEQVEYIGSRVLLYARQSVF